MSSIARYLAQEMEFDLLRALERTTESYRAELGDEWCTKEQARELRRLVCGWCGVGGRTVIADLDELPEAEFDVREPAQVPAALVGALLLAVLMVLA